MKSFIKRTAVVMTALIVVSVFLIGCNAPNIENKTEGSLVIGSDIYSPYFFLGDDGEFSGIDVDIATEACKRLNLTPVFKEIEWQSKEEYLKNGEVDCLWGCFTMNDREDLFSWAGPYMHSRQVVVVKASSDIRSLSDLNGKSIAVQDGSRSEYLFTNNLVDGVTIKKVYAFSTVTMAFAFLKKDYVDACAGNETACIECISGISGDYRILDEVLFSADLGVAFDKDSGSPKAEELTDVLSAMKRDGTIRKILENYDIDVDFALNGGANK